MSPQKIFAPAALLALMGLAPGVQAQSLNLYGVIDLAFGSFQSSYASTADNPRVTKLDSNPTITSFFGMKGMEDLGGGVKAGFMLESFLRPDTGASARSSADVFWARAANVWLETGYGKLTLGRQGSLLFGNTLSYNPLGGGFGLSPAIRLTFGAFGNDKSDSGFSNAVTYSLPTMGGFKAAVQYQFGEDATSAEKGTYALSASYTSGPFSIGGAWQTVRSAEAPKPNFNAGEKQTFGMLGTSYNAGFAKFFAQYGEFSNSGFTGTARIDTKLYTLGASVPVTKAGTVMVAYGESMEEAVEGGTTPDTDHSIFTLAYSHSLSKRTTLYTAYMMDKEDPEGTKFKTGHTYLVGVRHAF
ncbi:porin [Aquabacterium sp. A3]|uniref:porin n=1 Tax=Aquabacterium sp. A3 TaxID=3132829 RepID=UPI00311A1C66